MTKIISNEVGWVGWLNKAENGIGIRPNSKTGIRPSYKCGIRPNNIQYWNKANSQSGMANISSNGYHSTSLQHQSLKKTHSHPWGRVHRSKTKTPRYPTIYPGINYPPSTALSKENTTTFLTKRHTLTPWGRYTPLKYKNGILSPLWYRFMPPFISHLFGLIPDWQFAHLAIRPYSNFEIRPYSSSEYHSTLFQCNSAWFSFPGWVII